MRCALVGQSAAMFRLGKLIRGCPPPFGFLLLLLFHLIAPLLLPGAHAQSLPSQRETKDALRIVASFLKSEAGVTWLAGLAQTRSAPLTTDELMGALLSATRPGGPVWLAATMLRASLQAQAQQEGMPGKGNVIHPPADEAWDDIVTEIEQHDDIICLYRKDVDGNMKKSDDWQKFLKTISPGYTIHLALDKGEKYVICLKKIKVPTTLPPPDPTVAIPIPEPSLVPPAVTLVPAVAVEIASEGTAIGESVVVPPIPAAPTSLVQVPVSMPGSQSTLTAPDVPNLLLKADISQESGEDDCDDDSESSEEIEIHKDLKDDFSSEVVDTDRMIYPLKPVPMNSVMYRAIRNRNRNHNLNINNEFDYDDYARSQYASAYHNPGTEAIRTNLIPMRSQANTQQFLPMQYPQKMPLTPMCSLVRDYLYGINQQQAIWPNNLPLRYPIMGNALGTIPITNNVQPSPISRPNTPLIWQQVLPHMWKQPAVPLIRPQPINIQPMPVIPPKPKIQLPTMPFIPKPIFIPQRPQLQLPNIPLYQAKPFIPRPIISQISQKPFIPVNALQLLKQQIPAIPSNPFPLKKLPPPHCFQGSSCQLQNKFILPNPVWSSPKRPILASPQALLNSNLLFNRLVSQLHFSTFPPRMQAAPAQSVSKLPSAISIHEPNWPIPKIPFVPNPIGLYQRPVLNSLLRPIPPLNLPPNRLHVPIFPNLTGIQSNLLKTIPNIPVSMPRPNLRRIRERFVFNPSSPKMMVSILPNLNVVLPISRETFPIPSQRADVSSNIEANLPMPNLFVHKLPIFLAPKKVPTSLPKHVPFPPPVRTVPNIIRNWPLSPKPPYFNVIWPIQQSTLINPIVNKPVPLLKPPVLQNPAVVLSPPKMPCATGMSTCEIMGSQISTPPSRFVTMMLPVLVPGNIAQMWQLASGQGLQSLNSHVPCTPTCPSPCNRPIQLQVSVTGPVHDPIRINVIPEPGENVQILGGPGSVVNMEGAMPNAFNGMMGIRKSMDDGVPGQTDAIDTALDEMAVNIESRMHKDPEPVNEDDVGQPMAKDFKETLQDDHHQEVKNEESTSSSGNLEVSSTQPTKNGNDAESEITSVAP